LESQSNVTSLAGDGADEPACVYTGKEHEAKCRNRAAYITVSQQGYLRAGERAGE